MGWWCWWSGERWGEVRPLHHWTPLADWQPHNLHRPPSTTGLTGVLQPPDQYWSYAQPSQAQPAHWQELALELLQFYTMQSVCIMYRNINTQWALGPRTTLDFSTNWILVLVRSLNRRSSQFFSPHFIKYSIWIIEMVWCTPCTNCFFFATNMILYYIIFILNTASASLDPN